MRRTSYANVVATLALIVALGGTSYAATQITGKDVKNGSLKGKDVKDKSLTGKDVKDESLSGSDLQKQSVPLDRLSGSLPTQLDPGQFVPSAGPYTVTVGQGAWQSISPNLVRGNVFGLWVSTPVAAGATALILDPALPTAIAGKSMRLHAVTLCWDVMTAAYISELRITTYREDADGDTVDLVEIVDFDDQLLKECKRYAFPTPMSLADNRRVSLRLAVNWTASGQTIKIGGATLELDRA